MATRKQFKTFNLADMDNLNQTARKEQAEKRRLLDEADELEASGKDLDKVDKLRQDANRITDVFDGFSIEKKMQGPPKKKPDAAAETQKDANVAVYYDVTFRGAPCKIGDINGINLVSMPIKDNGNGWTFKANKKTGAINKVSVTYPLGWNEEAVNIFYNLGKKKDEIEEIKCESPDRAVLVEFFANIYRRFYELRKISDETKKKIAELETEKKKNEGWLTKPNLADQAKARIAEINKILESEQRKTAVPSTGKFATPLKVENLMDESRENILAKRSMLSLTLQFNSFKPGGDPISQIYNAKKINVSYKVDDEPPKPCPPEWIREDGGLTVVGEQAIIELRKKHKRVQKLSSFDPLTYEVAGEEDDKPIIKRIDPAGLDGKRLRIVNIEDARIECSSSPWGLSFSLVPHKIAADLIDSSYTDGMTQTSDFEIDMSSINMDE